MTSNRRLNHSRFHWKYERVWSSERCYYCGQLAGTVDHVPPLSVYSALPNRDEYQPKLVSCCSECNSLLGASPLLTLGRRRVYIRKALKHRYRKILSAPDWSEEELDELGPNLRSACWAMQQQKLILKARLKW